MPGFMGKELARMHALTMPLTRRVWGHASTIVVNSEGLHALAQRTVPGRTIDIVPNGVDLDVFIPAGDKQGDDMVRLLFVGRLANQKGLPYLMQALADLDRRSLSKVQLELVGSGPEEARLKSMVSELGLSEVVRFSGWVRVKKRS